MPPVFLTLDEVLAIHSDQLARYGGRPGIRDLALLESALAQPSASFGGRMLHADIFEMAAAYLFHIVQNHAFIDGNKRVGTAAAIIFLGLNEIVFNADETELEAFVRDVAQGLATKEEISAFLRKCSNS